MIRAEIDTLWESRPVGIFRGEPCIVLDDPGERLHITYLGTDADRAANLGYWQVDRGVFELLTQRDEVVGLTEERLERPLRWGEQTDETGPMASYPYGTAPWPIAPSTSVLEPPSDETSPAEAAPVEATQVEATQVEAAPVEASLVGAAPVEPPQLETSPVKTSRVKTSPVKAAPGADASMAWPPPASATPRTVTPPAVPAPLAAPVPAENGAQPPANTWPTGVSAGMDTHPGYAPAGDALSFPAATDSQPLTVPPGFPDPASTVPAPAPATDSQPLTVPPGFPDPAGITPAGEIGGRAARRQRVPTREIFCELADLASIPRAAYALETETDGAMCLLAAPDGFEVFIAADGARHEVRSFAEEEPAYFYLFGVLAAEAIRSGALAPAVVAANPYSGTV